MSTVRKFTPENRLAKAFDDPNGLLLRQALQRADANLENVRDAYLAALDNKLVALRTVEGDARYRLAQDILSDAGALGLRDLSRAALSLCDVLASTICGPSRDKAVAVHLAALAALRVEEAQGTAAQRQAILDGLRHISQRMSIDSKGQSR